MKIITLLFVILTTLICNTWSAKILGIFPIPAHSHYSLGFRIMKELADRGHEVTFINPYPRKEKIKNFKDISTESLIEKMMGFQANYYNFAEMTIFEQLSFLRQISTYLSRATFENKHVHELLHSNETFDLVFLEYIFVQPLAIFAHKFKCPLIHLVPTRLNTYNKFLVVNPYPHSYIPSLHTDFATPMSLWERIQNVFYDIVLELYTHLIMLPNLNEILKEFVKDAPKLTDLLYNTSLLFTISHPSLSDPIPLQANVKEIGGYHVAEPRDLPNDIKEFLDNATDGVVLFSMGSNLKSSNFPQEKIDAVLRSFGKIKQKVLWKFETDLPGKPDNVKILNWLPQSDVLAHPNVKIFIGHGGLLSTTEAVYHGVPMIGVPVYWDQKINIKTAATKGYAVSVPFVELTEEKFSWALYEVLNNPKYRNEMKLRSEILHSDPMKQLDAAVFWMEYVIKTNGARHLRSAGMDLNWFQRNLVDVIVLFIIVAILFLISMYYAIKSILKLVNSKIFSRPAKKKLL